MFTVQDTSLQRLQCNLQLLQCKFSRFALLHLEDRAAHDRDPVLLPTLSRARTRMRLSHIMTSTVRVPLPQTDERCPHTLGRQSSFEVQGEAIPRATSSGRCNAVQIFESETYPKPYHPAQKDTVVNVNVFENNFCK